MKLAAACGLVLGLPSALMECQTQKCMCLRNTGKSRGFVGMDAEYIAGLFVVEGHQGHGTGHQLISEVKRKNRLSLHAYECFFLRIHTVRKVCGGNQPATAGF